MRELATVDFEFEDSKEPTLIRYENGDSEDLMVTCVGPDLYRLEESSLFVGDAVFGDVIRARQLPDRALLFLSIAERSPLVTQSRLLSKQVIHSEPIRAILANIMELGGNWERAFGGLLITHVPAGSAKRISDEIAAAAKPHQ